jgi:hypothetical protein
MTIIIGTGPGTGYTFDATYYNIKPALQVAGGTVPNVRSNYGQHALTTGNIVGHLEINHLFIPASCGATGITLNGGIYPNQLHTLQNLAIGYDRLGASSPLTVGILPSSHGTFLLQNVVINATTEVGLPSTYTVISIDNWGHVDSAMLPGTGSDLDSAVVDAGGMKAYAARGYTLWGTWERSTLNPRTGIYHLRVTEGNYVSKESPLEIPIYIPIQSGQNISVSCYASRSGNSSDCAKIRLDPEGAWFTPAESSELLTNTATYYELTVSGATARGTGAKGMVRVVLVVDEYSASQYVDFDDLTVTIT